MVNSNKSTGAPPRAGPAGTEVLLDCRKRAALKAAAEPSYRLVLNLYSMPTEMAKLTSNWAVFGP
jgi:hypothetical protein